MILRRPIATACITVCSLMFCQAAGAQSSNYANVAKLLKKLDGKQSQQAATKLLAMGDKVLPDIIEYLNRTPGNDEDFASGPAILLAEYGAGAKPVLLSTLHHGGLRARIAVLFSVAYMSSMLASAESLPNQIPPEAMDDPQAKQALAEAARAVKHYKWIRDADAQAIWVKDLTDRDPAIRFSAAGIVGFLKLAEARAILRAALTDPNDQVGAQAFNALVNMGALSDAPYLGESMEAYYAKSPGVHRMFETFDLMGHMSNYSSPLSHMVLKQLMHAKSDELRAHAVRLLSLTPNREDLPDVEALFDDPSEDVRAQAAFSAANIARKSGEKYLPRVLELSRSTDAGNRSDAMRALSRLGGEEAYNRIVELAAGKDAEVRGDAASALGELGDERAKPLLEKMKKDSDDQVRIRAEMALDQLNMSPTERMQSEAQFKEMMDTGPSFVLQSPPRSPALAAKKKH